MNDSAIDLYDAIWLPTKNLGDHLLFVGYDYPIVRKMPPSVHDVESMPFMKHG